MAANDSTETPPAQLDYFEFSNAIDHEIWNIHAMATGADAIIALSDWETNSGLCSAKYLICDMRTKLEQLALRMDESSYTYIEKTPGKRGVA